MKRILASSLAAAVLAATGPAAAQMGSGMGRGMGMGMGQGAAGMNPVRHRTAMMNGIPAPYTNASNPLPATPENIAAGKTLFQQSCAACHGASGQGDGPAAASLNPPPSDLATLMQRPIATDAFLDWTISEGGVPVGSAMPPYKNGLKPEQIWQLVLFLRTL